ncbi:DgyrCDS4388 [Dimorphilus gyrociliatus]|uniref:DgyrCDS4388 n=1 Tax=Dimorphilus gyrociliatus TaxID=2664684 RepID=A0A7I8VIC7_9ANNE|nr:DgyrCDS4388 [Dimorphilus gyrociliatus]
MPHSILETSTEYQAFVELHKSQLLVNCVPDHLWLSLYKKLKAETFDSLAHFGLQKLIHDEDGEDYSWRVVCTCENGLRKEDTEAIFLVDHCWTFEVEKARMQLRAFPNLVSRMTQLMDITNEEDQEKEVLREMWKFCQTYSLHDPITGKSKNIWYIMDEFGSRIQHCDEPNIRIVPFVYQTSETMYTYSLLYLLNDLDYEEEITRNYIERPVSSDLHRKLLLSPWLPDDSLVEAHNIDLLRFPEEDEDQFLSYQDIEHVAEDKTWDCRPSRNDPLKVFTDFEFVKDEILDGKFHIVDSEKDADILFLRKHFKRYDLLQKGQYINQIMGDYVLTAKELCSVIARRDAENGAQEIIDPQTLNVTPDWYPISFNLSTELTHFIAYYNLREERELDNIWIVNPWNSSWMEGSIITDDLIQIIRQLDCGRRVVSKYVKYPLTLDLGREERTKIKLDFRFFVLVPDVSPLKIGILRQTIIRRAEKNYHLDYLDDQTRHTTTTSNADKMDTESFILALKQQYPQLNWDKVENETHSAIFKLFQSSTKKNFPMGLKSSQHSKPIYGVDVVYETALENEIVTELKPKIIKVTSDIDLSYLIENSPTLLSDCFSALFLQETNNINFVWLD